MYIRRQKGPVSIRLPDGSRLTRSDLPPPETSRWVARRKAVVVDALDHGLIDVEEALQRYQLSEEELEGWRSAVRQHGAAALHVTATQKYRVLKPLLSGGDGVSLAAAEATRSAEPSEPGLRRPVEESAVA